MVVFGYLLFVQTSIPIESNKILLGRSPTCHITFSHPSISKEHATIEFLQDGTIILKDLNSLNRTIVDNRVLARGGTCLLNESNKVQLGKDETIYRVKRSEQFPLPKQKSQKAFITVDDIPVQEDRAINLTTPQAPIIANQNEHLKAAANSFMSPQASKSSLTFAQTGESFHYETDAFKKDFANRLGSKDSKDSNNPISGRDLSNDFKTANLGKNKKVEMLEDEIRELTEMIRHRDVVINQKDNELRAYVQRVEDYKTENYSDGARMRQIENELLEVQRKNDFLTKEILEKNDKLNDLERKDWYQKAQDYLTEIGHLRRILTLKDDELNSLKNQLDEILKQRGVDNPNYIGEVIQKHASELSIAKMQIDNFENRAIESQRNWSELLKDINEKDQQIEGLTIQANRQVQDHEKTVSDYERRLSALHSRIAKLVNQDPCSKERDAAELLLSEMTRVQDDKVKLAAHNESLHIQIQGFIDQVRLLKNDIDEYKKFFERKEIGKGIYKDVPDVFKYRQKIQELENFIHEINKRDGGKMMSELTLLVADLEKKIAIKEKSFSELNQKLLAWSTKVGTEPQHQSILSFLFERLEEKDDHIRDWQRQNESLGKTVEMLDNQVKELRKYISGF